jgi:hypothetical protein
MSGSTHSGRSRRTPDIRGRAHRLDPTLAPLSAKLPVPVAEESGYAGSLCHLEESTPSCGRASNAKIESGFMDRPRLGECSERRSDFGDVDDRLGKGLWGFLRQVVPHAARDEPVLIFAREFAAISRGFRMGRAVGVAFHSDSQWIRASSWAA